MSVAEFEKKKIMNSVVLNLKFRLVAENYGS